MLIAKVENGQVLEVADYRSIFPNTSFTASGPNDEFLAENGCMPVTMWRQYDQATEKLVNVDPYVEGNAVYTVAVEAKSQEEIDAETAAKTEAKAAEVRAERNEKLSASDWTQVADAPVDQAAWAAYRQALRDVPEQAGFPWSVVWPEKP